MLALNDPKCQQLVLKNKTSIPANNIVHRNGKERCKIRVTPAIRSEWNTSDSWLTWHEYKIALKSSTEVTHLKVWQCFPMLILILLEYHLKKFCSMGQIMFRKVVTTVKSPIAKQRIVYDINGLRNRVNVAHREHKQNDQPGRLRRST